MFAHRKKRTRKQLLNCIYKTVREKNKQLMKKIKKILSALTILINRYNTVTEKKQTT